MDEDDNDTEQMKNIINVSKSLGFLCLVNGLVMFGDAVNTIKVGLGQEFSLHLSFGNQRIFKEAVGVFNLIALVRNIIFKETWTIILPLRYSQVISHGISGHLLYMHGFDNSVHKSPKIYRERRLEPVENLGSISQLGGVNDICRISCCTFYFDTGSLDQPKSSTPTCK